MTKDLRDEGLYTPIIGGAKSGPEAGRPAGTTKIKQQIKAQEDNFSFVKVKDNVIKFQQLQGSVENFLKKKHNKKKLNDNQKQVAEEISKIIIANESVESWEQNVEKYCNNPVDSNTDRVNEVNDIAVKHGLDPFMASILLNSKS
jgi:Fe2+ transport system protein B